MGFLLVIIGVLLIIIGVAGLVLPLIPGIVFIAFGFYLITFGDPLVSEKIRSRLKDGPAVFLDLFNAFDERMHRWFKRPRR
jgi:hypothetical protein